jgi:hypothetical protein
VTFQPNFCQRHTIHWTYIAHLSTCIDKNIPTRTVFIDLRLWPICFQPPPMNRIQARLYRIKRAHEGTHRRVRNSDHEGIQGRFYRITKMPSCTSANHGGMTVYCGFRGGGTPRGIRGDGNIAAGGLATTNNRPAPVSQDVVTRATSRFHAMPAVTSQYSGAFSDT